MYSQKKFGLFKSEAKLERAFIGPEIRKLLLELNSTELDVRKSFKQVVDSFLGTYEAESFVETVKKLLQSYQRLGCRMSLSCISSMLILTFFHRTWG